MAGGIQERVEILRREIAEIQKLNLAHLQTPKPGFGAIAEENPGRIRVHDRLEETVKWRPQ